VSEKPSGEKTEQPTQKRLDESRQQGQVVRSSDMVTTLATIAVLGTIWGLLPTMTRGIESFTRGVLDSVSSHGDKPMQPLLDSATGIFLKMVLPIACVSIAAVIIANVGQTGFVFASKAIEPNISKLNPFEGMKKIFSMKNILEFVKSSLKVFIIAILLARIIMESLDPVSKLPHMGLNSTFQVAFEMFTHLVVIMVFAFAIIAGADYFLQRHLTMKELMMTKDEVKREGKEQEGDPHVKGERRRIGQEMVFSDTAGAVKKSTVMVTNPTHFATAIYYERGVTELPVLLAKGSGFTALRMIEIAREESIPIVQNIPLAQDLHARVDINEIVPDDLLEAVADILRWVQSLPPHLPR
jgi:type III secretion protein U